jgi:hypothetical protein
MQVGAVVAVTLLIQLLGVLVEERLAEQQVVLVEPLLLTPAAEAAAVGVSEAVLEERVDLG